MPNNGGKDHVLIHGRIAYGWDGINAYPLKVNNEGNLLIVEQVIQVVRSKVIDASEGAYEALDVVNDDICTTTASPWAFSNVVRENGGLGTIIGAGVFNETEGVTPRLSLRLYNAIPSSQKTDNLPSTEARADRLLKVAQLDFMALESLCTTTDASTVEISPSTVGGLPKTFKCASGSRNLEGILFTRDAFTQTATDELTIVLLIVQH